jgi:formylglycine-generating enzyme
MKSITQQLNNYSFDMLPVKGGTFDMGEEHGDFLKSCSPIHKVNVSDFFIAKFPVTQALWKEVMVSYNPSNFHGDELPVESVSWEDITQNFLPSLQEKTNLPFRLPTEAEWEYAARGGTYSKDSYKYAGSDRLKDVAWYDENSKGQTKPVGLKQANQMGIFDMSGNVFEWCIDWFSGSEYYKECKKSGLSINPQGSKKGSSRVCRGGSWGVVAWDCQPYSRFFYSPIERNYHLGFRLALSLQKDGSYSSFPKKN